MGQGMLMLIEDEVAVRCCAKDDAVVQGAFAGAQAEYSRIISEECNGTTKKASLSLDSTKLAAGSLGGVVLTCQNGSITVDNTIDSRLGLVTEQAKPRIRQLLFN